jgi:hypothetical protein
MGIVEFVLLPEPCPMGQLLRRRIFSCHERMVDFTDDLLHTEGKESMNDIDLKRCPICSTYQGHNDFPSTPCTICEGNGRNELEDKNSKLKAILKTLSDDFLGVMIAFDEFRNQPAPVPSTNAEVDFLKGANAELSRKVGQLTCDLINKESALGKEREAHKNYETKLQGRLKEVKEGYDKYVHAATFKIAALNGDLEKERAQLKISRAPEIQKNIEWLVSERNSLARKCSDMASILEQTERLLENKPFESRQAEKVLERIKEYVYSGHKYYAPDYDDLMLKIQVAKKALSDIRILNNPKDASITTSEMTSTLVIAHRALEELEALATKPVKNVPPVPSVAAAFNSFLNS